MPLAHADRETSCITAIKQIHFPNFKFNPDFIDTVLREVRSLAKLNHVNVVKYFHTWLEYEERPIEPVQCVILSNPT